MTKYINVHIINYPGALQSATHGLEELFLLANNIASEQNLTIEFVPQILQLDSSFDPLSTPTQILICPPSIQNTYFQNPSEELLSFINHVHRKGGILCSACAGAFLLGAAGQLNHKRVTTHWKLAEQLQSSFPDAHLQAESILINEGNLITAGGIMSWVDLGLELVAHFMSPQVMRNLGKYLIVDTGKREQRYYQSFTPRMDHGYEAILKTQHYLHKHYGDAIKIEELASQSFMTKRTFLRKFTEATGLKPLQYLQRVRIQSACNLLESTQQTAEQIAFKVGYEDVNSFRKVFTKIMGLTPTEFKDRFSVGT
ncbi:GlxA family transcriptional regulator [Litoribrevibacter euphylliae]|uniref:GlxA family transcriptional regulator n=1 Tax=Litoribrevibacter euphylliae TaxID=1834034 RepID=A0ABV7HD56_9GAMM